MNLTPKYIKFSSNCQPEQLSLPCTPILPLFCHKGRYLQTAPAWLSPVWRRGGGTVDYRCPYRKLRIFLSVVFLWVEQQGIGRKSKSTFKKQDFETSADDKLFYSLRGFSKCQKSSEFLNSKANLKGKCKFPKYSLWVCSRRVLKL